MTYQEMQKMSDDNARLRAAIKLMLSEVEYEIENNPNSTLLKAVVDIGQNALVGRKLDAKKEDVCTKE